MAAQAHRFIAVPAALLLAASSGAASPAYAANARAGGGSDRLTGRKMKTGVDLSKVESYCQQVRADYEKNLKDLVDTPSVSMDPAHRPDITRLAERAVSLLSALGADARLIETQGNPVVFAQFAAQAGDPTVLVYNHLDVQPADASEWQSPPFRMAIDGGIYRGRGTTDDKGPALSVLYAARYARENRVPLNIKFVWELEEEIGSPSFAAFLKENEALLKCDSVVVSDTIWVSRERPSIPYGLRGLQGFLVRLTTGAKDVHSGLTGGLARNPIGELAQLIAQCYDAKTGRVLIPGFYDDVRPPSEEETDNFVKSGFTVEGFKKAHELTLVRTGEAREGSQRIWALPTMEIHGIVGGYTGPGVKTIVPHQAEAKISMRLVPDQQPEKVMALVENFIHERNPDCQVVREGSLSPFLGDISGPYARAARQAMIDAFAVEPAFTREGGSIGPVLSMSEVLAAPVVFLGLSLPEHGYHAINEYFDWQQASGGIKLFASYFSLLSQIKR